MHPSPALPATLADRVVDLHIEALTLDQLMTLPGKMISEWDGLLRAPDGHLVRTEAEGEGQRHCMVDGGLHRTDRLHAVLAGARCLRVFALGIPTLFQTDAYRAASSTAGAPSATYVRPAWAPSLERPATLILDEYALRRPRGGPAVMAEQLCHLRELAEAGGVTVLVLPADACLAAPAGALHEITRREETLYAIDSGLAVFYQSGPHGPALRALMDRFERAALTPQTSLRRLAAAAAEMEGRA
ncbi:Scr1 family TA system antitoxin-like transcriptional regulator [Streptomyces sp. DH12]|uniref:Scr1 family TA system antitoxin-like transcriptional regulator n=1 Tax=Streptomyces sp. DH12 TaxID=2857010 RepID=UPI001E57F801|nr:Scr1 family TA system antitoxin-like transcriptional regulator [Streptomyces sp. DH12]